MAKPAFVLLHEGDILYHASALVDLSDYVVVYKPEKKHVPLSERKTLIEQKEEDNGREPSVEGDSERYCDTRLNNIH